MCNEEKKLKAMIQRAMEFQARDGKDKWGPIKTNSETPCGKYLKPPQTPSNLTGVSAFTDLDFAETFLNENDFLENDRYKLQEKLLSKDCELEQLQRNECLQCQILKINSANKIMTENIAQSETHSSVSECESEVRSKVYSVVSKSDELSTSMQLLEAQVCQLSHELQQVQKERKIAFDLKKKVSQSTNCRPKTSPCNDNDNQTTSKLKNLQSQYTNLQIEFCRKERQCKDMAEQMKKYNGDCNEDNERIVNEALKKRADTLVGEIEDYKVFINELQEQVDLYRNKFMTGKIIMN